jgi:hypothetical protein
MAVWKGPAEADACSRLAVSGVRGDGAQVGESVGCIDGQHCCGDRPDELLCVVVDGLVPLALHRDDCGAGDLGGDGSGGRAEGSGSLSCTARSRRCSVRGRGGPSHARCSTAPMMFAPETTGHGARATGHQLQGWPGTDRFVADHGSVGGNRGGHRRTPTPASCC